MFRTILLLGLVAVSGCGSRSESTSHMLAGDGLPPAPFDSITGEIGEPDLEIGSSAEMFGVSGGLLLRNGRMVVAGRDQLHFFNEGGELETRVGRGGDGPGEYRQVASVVRWSQDSIAVVDERSRRVTVLDEHGQLGRTISVEPGSWPLKTVHWLSDGTFVVPEGQGFETMTRGAVWRDTVVIQRYSASGAPMGQIGSVLGDELYIGEEFGLAALVPPVHQKKLLLGATGSSVVIASPDSVTIRYIGPDGTVRISRQMPIEVKAITQEEINRHAEEQLARHQGVANARERLSKLLGAIPADGFHAHLSRLLVGADGHVWIGEYSGAGYPPKRWLVLSDSGEFMGAVAAMPGYTILDVDGDRVLMTRPDSLDQRRVYVATVH